MCRNVENPFLPPAVHAAAQDRFQRKLANLPAVIDGEQPDVQALQEVDPRCPRGHPGWEGNPLGVPLEASDQPSADDSAVRAADPAGAGR